MNISHHFLLLGASCIILSASCTSFNASEQDSQVWDALPEHFATATSSVTTNAYLYASNAWWESEFEAPELNKLIAQGLQGNLNLQQVAARIEQTQASVIVQRASARPRLNVDADVSLRRAGQTDSEGNQKISTNESYRLGLAGAYELDLWGRLNALTQAELEQYEATKSEYAAAVITLSSEISLRWLGLIQQQVILKLLEQQLKINGDVLDLIKLRFRKSQANSLDVYQQEEAVARIRALIPPEELRKETLSNELARLLGQMPGTGSTIASKTLPTLKPIPEIGLPIELLINRPDVQQAIHQLEAARFSVDAAQADRLPAIRLTGSAAYSSDDLSTLFDDWFGSLTAGLLGPLLDGGKRKASVQRQEAVVKQRVAAYRDVLLTAVVEVENALAAERSQAKYVDALNQQFEAAKHSYEESLNRYRKGLNKFLPALTAQLSMQSTERNLIRAQHDQLTFRIALLRALGGTWANETIPLLETGAAPHE